MSEGDISEVVGMLEEVEKMCDRYSSFRGIAKLECGGF